MALRKRYSGRVVGHMAAWVSVPRDSNFIFYNTDLTELAQPDIQR